MSYEQFHFRVGSKRYRAQVRETSEGTILVESIYGGHNACLYDDASPRDAGDRMQALVELAIAHYAIRRMAALATHFTTLADEGSDA